MSWWRKKKRKEEALVSTLKSSEVDVKSVNDNTVENKNSIVSKTSKLPFLNYLDYNYWELINVGDLDKFLESINNTKILSKFGEPEKILEVELPGGYEVVESYWVYKPFAKVHILENKTKNEYLYFLSEPILNKEEKYLLSELKEIIKIKFLYGEYGEDGRNMENILKSILEEYNLDVDKILFAKLYYYIERDLLGFYKIDGIMRDPYIEDISCDGWDVPIFVYHWHYGNLPTNVKMGFKELDSFVIRLAQKSNKHISLSNPMIDATLPDGSRVQLTLGREVTARGSTFTIRKFKEILITPIDLIKWKTFSVDEMAYLWLSVETGKSVLVVGGTASGKTTTLNAIALFIPLNAKIITIEDTRELKLIHPNWIPSVTRESFTQGSKNNIDMYDLLKAALRQRPEYILVGEVRGQEAQTLFQAMSTGHTTMSTLHADSVESAIYRLEYPPLSVPRSMLAALDIVCVQAQTFVGGKRVRRNLAISEITEIDSTTKKLKTLDIFAWDPQDDEHKFLLGDLWDSKVLQEIMKYKVWDEEDLKKEFERRKAILKKLLEIGITSKEFVGFMRWFQMNPEETTKKLLGEKCE